MFFCVCLSVSLSVFLPLFIVDYGLYTYIIASNIINGYSYLVACQCLCFAALYYFLIFLANKHMTCSYGIINCLSSERIYKA